MRFWVRAALLLGLVFVFCAPALASDGGLIYYVYAPACGSCAKMKAVLTELNAPGITIEEIDIFGQPDRANALFDRYGVPEQDRLAPALFIGDNVILDPAEAAQTLQAKIDAGAAKKTLTDMGQKPGGLPALSILGTAAAGFVAGLNPCALSMLLFFLVLLLPLERGAGGAAAAFLTAKYCAYVLIGTALVSLFRAWNPVWLPLAAKWLLTVVGVSLVAVNLHDAWRASRAEYGEIKNQLPRGLRAFLHRSMKRAMAEPGPRLALVAILLGLIVAATEFMCSGQLYLATLTAGLERGEQYGAMLMQLLLFCAAFLMPSVIVTALVLGGKQAMLLSGWMLEKMPLIKLVTAIAMTAVIIAAWLM